MTKKLLLTFALLLTAVTGAFADFTPQSGDVWDETTKTLTVNSNPGDYTYYQNDEIQNLVIAANVTEIGESAFYECPNLATVTFDGTPTLTTIGSSAFQSCYGLTSIEIPASVTSIGTSAFAYCSSIATMTVEAGNTFYDSRNGCNAIIEKSSNTLIAGCKGTIIPATVTTIGNSAFQGCDGLISITIPASVTRIDDWAFYDCSNLATITIPSSVESINYGVFTRCRNIATMTVEAGNTFYDSRNGCNAIIEKSSNTLIAGCNNTTIPDDVTSIGDYAFQGCDGLTTVTIPTSVTNIGNDAFFDCTAVTDVYCNADPAALTWYENGCDDFKYDGSTIIHVTDADPWYAKFGDVVNGIFRDSSPVTPLIWEYNTTTKTLTISGTDPIQTYSNPEDCPWKDDISEVENIVINNGMKGIGKFAFCDYSALTSVTIPASVKSIGRSAFYNCPALKTVTFDGTPTLKTIGMEAFCYCSGLTSITIPATVTSIGTSTFQKCSALTSITIPASVTRIDDWAFYDCSNLATITLNSNPYIGYGAFEGIASGATVTMNLTGHEGATGEYWMTFYNYNYNFQADANTQAFKAALDENKLTLTELTSDKIVQHDGAVILKSTSSSMVMTLTTTDSSNDFIGNQLQGVYDPAGLVGDGNIYVLGKGSGGVGFYKLAPTGTIGVGKAYLTYSGASPSNFFGFEEGETTDIELKNSRIEELKFYDLNGRRVENPTKGIYIVNGKKVVIK